MTYNYLKLVRVDRIRFLSADGCSDYTVPDNTSTRWGLTFSHAQGTIVGIPDLTDASTQVQNGRQVSATASPATVSFNIEIGEMSADGLSS